MAIIGILIVISDISIALFGYLFHLPSLFSLAVSLLAIAVIVEGIIFVLIIIDLEVWGKTKK